MNFTRVLIFLKICVISGVEVLLKMFGQILDISIEKM